MSKVFENILTASLLEVRDILISKYGVEEARDLLWDFFYVEHNESFARWEYVGMYDDMQEIEKHLVKLAEDEGLKIGTHVIFTVSW